MKYSWEWNNAAWLMKSWENKETGENCIGLGEK